MRRGLPLCFVLLTQGLAWGEERPVGSVSDPVEQQVRALMSDDLAIQQASFAALVESTDPALLNRLQEIRDDADRSTRLALKPVMDLVKNRMNLANADPDQRRSAASDLGALGYPIAIPWLQAALTGESHRWVRYAIQEALALIQLQNPESRVQLTAVQQLGDLASQHGLSKLKDMVASTEQAEASPGATADAEVIQSARQAIEKIERWAVWSSAFETVFHGISLSSILLLMALGLAIVFGLMGVINMAHGELMMVGAYATFMTQEFFKAYAPPDIFDWYFWAALPVAFCASAALGLVLETTLIRFLYGRPLETMLATWGVSLVLIQAARVTFGDLTAVTAPSWFSGGVQVMVGLYLPFNRLFIIGLSMISVIGIYLLLFRSGLGLRVRAVMQNRPMSACLGIPTRTVDAYTFAFGSGLAGLAGWALTLVGNVDPGLGQNYIVDSFMVVVTGGVGKLAGTVVAALGIGSLNKLFEPSFGAVYAKVLILLLVVLFLQRRPSGLFAIKGRHADA
ncbi:MAG: urea ABC transporter permease subunit UrtB [Nitrospiraceae bacterium]